MAEKGELADKYLEAMDMCEEAARLARAAGVAALTQAKSIRIPGGKVQASSSSHIWFPSSRPTLSSVRVLQQLAFVHGILFTKFAFGCSFARAIVHRECIGLEPESVPCRLQFTRRPREGCLL